jgi:competence protein ComEA
MAEWRADPISHGATPGLGRTTIRGFPRWLCISHCEMPRRPRCGVGRPSAPRYHPDVTRSRRLARPRIAVGLASIASAASFALALSTPIVAAPTDQNPPATQSVPEHLPEGTGKSAVIRVCGNCHGTETVVERLKTRQEWSDTVDSMARFGAEASDAEFEQILAYLVKFYSPIRVNKATAKELETTLDIPADVAEAIVRVRTDKGAFTAVDDLKAVPGLEWSKVEARKARLVFST